MKIFGPVPSRRLGQSLGINNIPPKYCSYACVYCQLGRAIKLDVKPREFYSPAELFELLCQKLDHLRDVGDQVDYLTIVADGEPTLDQHLGDLIDKLRSTAIPVAVISNGTRLSDPLVRCALSGADWVSVKVDTVDADIWRTIDRPCKGLNIDDVLAGIKEFAAGFRGTLTTETMLVSGINDDDKNLYNTCRYIEELKPKCAYLSAPVRPPAEPWVKIPGVEVLTRAFQIFSQYVSQVEYLIGYEGNAFAHTNDPAEDLLSITAVHPMREDAVYGVLHRTGADFGVVEDLLKQNLLTRTIYNGHCFYARTLR